VREKYCCVVDLLFLRIFCWALGVSVSMPLQTLYLLETYRVV
jgi:hypothetical protein